MGMANKLLVINVLSAEQYEDCHIKGSINVPLEKLESYAKDFDRETPIVTYCANYACSASRYAWQALDKMGFKNVWAYEGGIAEWYQGGFMAKGACSTSYISEPTQKPVSPSDDQIRRISAEELRALMAEHGIL